MLRKTMKTTTLLSILACLAAAGPATAGNAAGTDIGPVVDEAIRPLMQQYAIPGMAVAVTVDRRQYFYNYSVASKETRKPVTSQTLFEIGSLSKTFTATLAAYAQADGALALSDSADKYLPSLQGSSFDKITLINLGTHTAGGLPLQIPENIKDTRQLMAYYKSWRPRHAAGTYRTYSNASVGMLGVIAAKSLNMSFDDALEKKLFPALGMMHSYLHVPAAQMAGYAQGYNKNDAPVRLNPGMLSSEAYGVKSNTADMIRFIEANMDTTGLDDKLGRALMNTHTGYFKAGEMTQDLIWEQYPYPTELKQVLAGNSDAFIYQDVKAEALNPPLPPQANVLINKTGSTNGFAVYAAFVPARKIGVVIFANKSYPIAPRVTAAYRILTVLDAQAASLK
ncbi:class C beta-lactamase [Herbaspirillum sp. RV1423]|uniref:class C beta-lactamase n=1 Tax=Herbaspirillum sp. RV1423 TaxID=1443993 RepID=UPI000558DEC0